MTLEVTQNDLNEVARLIFAANNQGVPPNNAEDVTIAQLLALVKAPATAPVATAPVLVLEVDAPDAIFVQAASISDPDASDQVLVQAASDIGASLDSSATPTSSVPSADPIVSGNGIRGLTDISIEYSAKMKIFSAYVSELKCVRLNEATKNTLKTFYHH